MSIPLYRPQPVSPDGANFVDRHTPPWQAAAALRDGERLLVRDLYGTGADIVEQLAILMRAPHPDAPYAQRHAHKMAFREASMRLLAPIHQHRLDLAHAEPIPFLAELYPDERKFVLPFVQVQELYGAWQTYAQGVRLAVLGHSLHPFYGTYAPTRTTHLELFATWLSAYTGSLDAVADVGTGSGVLAFLLARAGAARIIATDSSANALVSVSRDIERRKTEVPIELVNTDLLHDVAGPLDLIAFNPPWTHGEVSSPLDAALYFDDDLFERFFDQAAERLAPNGRIVIVFSNIIELLQPDVPHPINSELQRARFELSKKVHRKVKPTGRQRRTKERVEVWELSRKSA